MSRSLGWLVLAACTQADVLSTRQLDVSIAVVPASAAMGPGTSRELTARVTGTANTAVTWASSAGTIAGTGNTITFTAPGTPGQVTVTATSHFEPERSATAVITVTDSVAYGLAIPAAHPRIWYDGDRLATARAQFAQSPWTPARDAWSETALRALLANDPQACRPAIDRALAHDVSSFTSDIASWHAQDAILAYDWCFDAWTSAERADFIARWNGFLQLEVMQAWGDTAMPQSDVFWFYLRNELLFGLATFHENPMADGFLRHALDVRWQSAFVPSAAGPARGGVLQPGSNRAPSSPARRPFRSSARSCTGATCGPRPTSSAMPRGTSRTRRPPRRRASTARARATSRCFPRTTTASGSSATPPAAPSTATS